MSKNAERGVAHVFKRPWLCACDAFLAGVINYLDRSALSVAAPFIQEDLHISPAQMGMLFSSFFIGYAVFNFIGGWASDKYGAKHTLSAAMVVWSVFSGAIALTYNFASLFIIRVIFGMGEGPLSAATSKAVNNWFPKRKGRGRSEWPCAELRSEGLCRGRSSG